MTKKLMRRINYIAILIAVTFPFSSSIAQSPGGSKYVGYKYEAPRVGEKLSNGFEHYGGGLIGDIDADRVYGVSVLKNGKAIMFWLEVSIARNENGGVTKWEVLDSLEFSNLRSFDYVMEFSEPAFQCKRGKKIIENLVGIGKFSVKRGIFTPHKLWSPNAKTAKFESVSVKNIRCIYSEP